MRKFLDSIFANKKLSILIPILYSTLLYLIFILFGTTEDKMGIITITPIASIFIFFGVFLVIYIQVKNKWCPEGFLNFFELIAIIACLNASISFTVFFVVSGFQSFTPITSAAPLIYASIAWAHSKRTK